jgi:hypothetical protein
MLENRHIEPLSMGIRKIQIDLQETMSPPDAPSCIAVLRDQTKSDEIEPKPSIRVAPSNLALC